MPLAMQHTLSWVAARLLSVADDGCKQLSLALRRLRIRCHRVSQWKAYDRKVLPKMPIVPNQKLQIFL
jgi:hypothetical protein